MTPWFRGLLLAAGLLFLAAGPGPSLRAQGGEDLPVGSRIRVTAPGRFWRPTEGVLAGWRRDSLLVDLGAGETVALESRSVAVEVFRGTRGHPGTGALIGFGIGAAATAWFLAGFCEDPDTLCQVGEVAVASLFIAAPATAAGALIGLAVRSERWEPVVMGGRTGGAGIGIRVALPR